MDSFKFHDIRVEKANAISRYRRTQRIATLFRFVELFVFLIIVSRVSAQFVLPFKLSGESFKGISLNLISPRFVFLVGNAIVVVLFFISGRFSAKDGEKVTDFYEEYVEKCRHNEERKASDTYKYGKCDEERKMYRSNSERNMMHGVTRRRELTRSMTEGCRRSPDCGRKQAAADRMSNEEFRRTVEAFIARQQRALREEDEDVSAVVSATES